MANLPVPVPAQQSAGNLITGALWNANVYNGLTFLLNPPLFYGYSTVATALSASTYKAIGLDTGPIDTYGGHSTTTNTSRYVAQVAGVYEVTGSVSLQPSTGTIMAGYVAKNGVEITGSRFQLPVMSGHYNGSPTMPVQVQLSVGDYVEVYAYSDIAINTAAGPWCSLSVRFLHT